MRNFPVSLPSFILVTVAVFAVNSRCFSAAGIWKTYTSKREVRNIAVDVRRGTLWAATGGGLFSFRIADSSFTQYTASEGLRTIDLTALAIDSSGSVWAGASNGFLHSFNPESNQWLYVPDIYTQQVPQKQINGLTVYGDTLFVLSDIGVSVLSVSRSEFGDTYRRFGSTPNQLNGSATAIQLFHDSLWVATRSGIAVTPASAPNPSAPESWQVFTSLQGLPSNAVSGLAVLDDTLYAGCGNGMAFWTGNGWSSVPGTAGINIVAMTAHQGCASCIPVDTPRIRFVSLAQVGTLQSSGSVGLVATSSAALTSVVDGGVYALGSSDMGALFPRNIQWISIVPPGPPTNNFYGMAVDNAGVLWSGTGFSSTDGFVRFDGKSWRAYTPATDPIVGSADSGGGSAFQIDIGANNVKWVSLAGTGVAMVNANDSVAKAFNTGNGLPYTANQFNHQRFVVVTGVATDAQGSAWMNVRQAIDRRVLAIYSPSSGTFSYVQYPTTPPVLINIVMDSYGTAWLSTQSDVGNPAPGLVFYNPTTGWDIVTQSDGLTDNQISTVAVDNDQNIWVGTVSGGIDIIFDPTSPHDHILIYHPLNDQRIYDILVDPINNKWVATNNGVFLLSSDGTSILAQYSVESTDGKVPDDMINSIAMNRKNGTVYIGTSKGLAALSTTAIAPAASLSSLTISPNPFFVPSTSQMTVDGLVAGSSLKILSIDGKLVRSLSTPGGRVGFWDGMDDHGRPVGTGVYIVAAYSADGNQVATGKVAVIRK